MQSDILDTNNDSLKYKNKTIKYSIQRDKPKSTLQFKHDIFVLNLTCLAYR